MWYKCVCAINQHNGLGFSEVSGDLWNGPGVDSSARDPLTFPHDYHFSEKSEMTMKPIYSECRDYHQLCLLEKLREDMVNCCWPLIPHLKALSHHNFSSFNLLVSASSTLSSSASLAFPHHLSLHLSCTASCSVYWGNAVVDLNTTPAMYAENHVKIHFPDALLCSPAFLHLTFHAYILQKKKDLPWEKPQGEAVS